MRVFEIPAQTIEVYGYNEDEFQRILQRFKLDFTARPYRKLTLYERIRNKILKRKYVTLRE